MKHQEYDVIVIGGGHAGTEAALVSARMGSKTLLITHNIDTVGQMSCNPAIGGIGKSHLVKEIDALGGAMAIATDYAGIQFRVLNARKGPAVRATRAQVDRSLYKAAIRRMVEEQPNLSLFQQAVDDLIVEGDNVTGVITQMGLAIKAKKIVLTAGTFLGGKIHIGPTSYSGGRAGDPPAIRLAERLRELPLRVERLKTGTPARIDAKSVDFTCMEPQWGDTPTPNMSYLGSNEQHPEQICCYITHTNERTHEIIRSGLDRSPLFSGAIEGVGPRYCPSIEDKIVRFSDKNSHQIFVEPEGLNSKELYPNGISTSLPYDVQLDLIHSISGFENAHVTRAGYAIEYDFFDPRDLEPTLALKCLNNLYFAGQINGTTGYEEAGAQGLLAGINASLAAQEKESWYPKRNEAYMGVMVDDLVCMGTKEPYRMFTSRAEYRLMLREDNADERLTQIGRKLGIVNDQRWAAYCKKQALLAAEEKRLKDTWVHPSKPEATELEDLIGKPLRKESTLYDLLRRPEVDYSVVRRVFGGCPLDDGITDQILYKAKYEGYIARQNDEVKKMQGYEAIRIPTDFDYSSVKGLSNELLQKLQEVYPGTLGQASRIPGMTPAAISILMIYLKKMNQTTADSI